MVAIKRYPNRKLYNTDTKQYITLDGLADLICGGEEIVVTDNASGEDLTAVILTQIILEQEKEQNGVLPHSALMGLVRAGGDRISALQRGLLSPLGLWGQVDDEIKRRIQVLVEAGELSEIEGADLIEKLIVVGQQMRTDKISKGSFDRPEDLEVGEITKKRLSFADVEAYLRQHQLPSQKDIRQLSQQLADLETRLEEISRSRSASG